MNSADFTMFDVTGALVGAVDTTVTGSIGGGVWAVTSTTTFFGLNWTAHSGTTFGPGTYSFDTCNAGVTTNCGTYTNLIVGAGQVGGHILFNWGATTDIDVPLVWDISDNGNGTVTYTSTDASVGAVGPLPGPITPFPIQPDGILGTSMIDGAFPGFNANFNFVISAPPTAVNDNKGTTANTLVNIDLAGNDSAAAIADSAAATPAAVPPATINLPGTLTTTQGGTLIDKGDGTVDYTPPLNFTSPPTDDFQYTLTDESGRTSAPATTTITVTLVANTPPVANDVDFSTLEDTSLDIAVTDTDDNGTPVATDGDGDSLIYASFDAASKQGGTVTRDDSKTVLTYSPKPDSNGEDTFTFTVNDGIDNSNAGTITVNVTPVNDPRVCADVKESTLRNIALDINVAKQLLSTCDDPDETDTISLDSTTPPTQTGSTLSFDGNNILTYTPATDFVGQDTFTYTATDGTAFDTKTVFIDVIDKVFGNFTMLDADGVTFGGTNDLVTTWDLTKNTDVTSTNFNMTMASDEPSPFFGFVWIAHHIRVFGPGTYMFDSSCSTAQVEQGIADCGGTAEEFLTLTVGPGQIGAHILFDWNVTENIDVVNLWEPNAMYTNPDPRGAMYLGPTGPTPDVECVFEYASVDGDGDTVPGVRFVDGPFIGFRANYNLNFNRNCGAGEAEIQVSTIKSSDPGGCTLSSATTTPLKRSDLWLMLGFIALLGAFVARRRILSGN
jgi:hypothetical protein